MTATHDTVRERMERARVELTPARVAVGIALVAAVGCTLLFLQEPLVHDSLHNFRHSVGITCH